MLRRFSQFDLLALWILWSTFCSASGWLLSAFEMLDRVGYALLIVLFIAGMWLTRANFISPSTRGYFLLRWPTYRRWPSRFWLALVLVSLAGGLCYHADNYDYLTYRFPRVLHWWWQHRWHWIDTTNDRSNFSATGFEWLMMPLFVLFRSDRPFFLINLISYLFLPGLVFSTFRYLGVGGRIAWWWMWVLPAGICYALQAGGLGNDMFNVVYLLAAFHYGSKARSGSLVALSLSILSLALLTGAKASNLPLVAPWLVLMVIDQWPWFRCDPRTIGILLGVCLIAALVSILPVFLANYHFSGDWGGDPTNGHKVKLSNPVAGILGNSIIIAVVNLSPPIWPHDLLWPALPCGLQNYLTRNYPRFGMGSSGLQLEESCSLGLGIVCFWILSLARSKWMKSPPGTARSGVRLWIVAAATAIAWLAYLMKLGSEAAPRLVAPYYALTIAVTLALLPLDGAAARSWLWRAVACFAMLTGLAVVVLTPGRPVLPNGVLSAGLQCLRVSPASIDRLVENRALRASRYDDLQQLRLAIPESEKKVGLIGGGDNPNISLWLPFGAREVVELDPRRVDFRSLFSRGIHYIAISSTFLKEHDQLDLVGLLDEVNGEVVQEGNVTFKTRREREHWVLVRLHGT